MQSDAAVDGEYETFDLHLPVSRQLIVRRVSFPVGPPRGWGGFGAGNLRGGTVGFFPLLTRGGRFKYGSHNIVAILRHDHPTYSGHHIGYSRQLSFHTLRSGVSGI